MKEAHLSVERCREGGISNEEDEMIGIGDVTDQDFQAKVDKNMITQYRVTAKITFVVDEVKDTN